MSASFNLEEIMEGTAQDRACRVTSIGSDELPAAITLWRIDLDLQADIPEDMLGRLDAAELNRAARYQQHADRVRFTITRVVLKHALSRVAPGTDPREIHLDADCRDKPLWKGQPIEFNVTHSGKQAYVAVSRFGRVGVDVEEQRADFDYEEVCATVFTGKELHALSEIPPSHRRRGFYDCWVRKEAVLKATGLGITQCLQDFSTVRGACDRWRIEVSECADSSTAAMLRSLSISMLDAGPKYSAAIAFDMQPKA